MTSLGITNFITRGLGDYDQSEAIAGELSSHTFPPIDVTNHPNIGELPPISECGFSSITPQKYRRRKKRIVGKEKKVDGCYLLLNNFNVCPIGGNAVEAGKNGEQY